MTKAITYTLRLEEPCLLAAPGGDPNTESSLDYIPGGAMRGALAAAYLRAHGEDALFAPLFLSGRARFLNAYPYLEGRALPSSRAWAMKKDDDKTVYNRLIETERDEVEKELPQGFKPLFVWPMTAVGDLPMQTPDIAHEIAVHTARNRQKGRAIENDADSALFRYRALARDQCFAGAIVLEDDLPAGEVARLMALLEGQSLLLGGSQTAGYGLMGVEDVRSHAAWREAQGSAVAVGAEESFVVYLTAPAILYDPATGQPTSDIRPFLPGNPQEYAANYTFEDRYATTIWVGGFNKHRGLPLSQQWAVQMGSTWRIKTKQALSAGDLAALERRGIGLRREEGFGRLLFSPPWPGQPFTTKKVELFRRPAVSAPASVSDDLLTRMKERMARRELDQRLALAVTSKSQTTVRGHLSRSQFGRLMVRIRQEADKNDLQGFVAYLESTKKRKSADDQFRKYSVDGKNFRDFLTELAEKPESVWDKIGAEEAHRISRAEVAHSYTVRYISDLCRQLAKREVGQ